MTDRTSRRVAHEPGVWLHYTTSLLLQDFNGYLSHIETMEMRTSCRFKEYPAVWSIKRFRWGIADAGRTTLSVAWGQPY